MQEKESRSVILAQCDAHVSNDLIAKKNRRVRSMVAEIDDEAFKKLLDTKMSYKKTYNLLKSCYQEALGAGFFFEHDDFGGYGLFYGKDENFIFSRNRDLLLPNLHALLQSVKGEELYLFEPISIFAGTEICRNNRIMIGPVRFANHSCRPNTQYVASTYKNQKCVKLKITKNIQKNDELTVFYGENFFGEGNWDCQCPHSEMHAERPLIFSNKQLQLISANLEKRFVRLYSRKKRDEPAPKKMRSYEMRFFTESESQSSIDHEDGSADLENSSMLFTGEGNNDTPEVENNDEGNQIGAPEDFLPDISDSSTVPPDSPDLPCSVVGDNFETAINSIVAKHGTSDQETKDWLSLMRSAFPDAKLPSFSSLKRRYHVFKSQHQNFVKSCSDGEYWVLDFVSELHQIVQSNLEFIEEYSQQRDPNKDIKLQPCLNFDNKNITISLVLNSDGVRFVKSSRDQLWPVWLAIADLPPVLRCSYKNIVLAALWRGAKKPDWEPLFNDLGQLLSRRMTLEYKQMSLNVTFKIILLIADIPATASMLNMHHHLAKYGCTLCLIETDVYQRSRYYPLKKYPMRTQHIYSEHLQKVQMENLQHYMGVKGVSPLSKLVKNLPLTAPPDVMHQVYLGVTKVLLQVIVKETHRTDMECLRHTVSSIKLPLEFKRSVRSLNDLEYFKANELKVWLLYIGPALFSETINETRANRFCLLSYAIRLLMLDTSFCNEAEKQINRFLEDTKLEYTETVFSANMHALTHLTWQVRNFGPLWTTSSMMFESANYLLSSKFSGTVNHLPLLVERYNRNKAAWRSPIVNDQLSEFCEKMRAVKVFKHISIPNTDVPEDLRKNERQFYRNLKWKNFVFDISTNGKDSYVAAFYRGEIICGKLRMFYSEKGEDYASVERFKVVESRSSPLGSTHQIYSFFLVEESSELITFNQKLISNKLLFFRTSIAKFLVPLIEAFEHD